MGRTSLTKAAACAKALWLPGTARGEGVWEVGGRSRALPPVGGADVRLSRGSEREATQGLGAGREARRGAFWKPLVKDEWKCRVGSRGR